MNEQTHKAAVSVTYEWKDHPLKSQEKKAMKELHSLGGA